MMLTKEYVMNKYNEGTKIAFLYFDDFTKALIFQKNSINHMLTIDSNFKKVKEQINMDFNFLLDKAVSFKEIKINMFGKEYSGILVFNKINSIKEFLFNEVFNDDGSISLGNGRHCFKPGKDFNVYEFFKVKEFYTNLVKRLNDKLNVNIEFNINAYKINGELNILFELKYLLKKRIVVLFLKKIIL